MARGARGCMAAPPQGPLARAAPRRIGWTDGPTPTHRRNLLMPAPTWPLGPEEGDAETLAEYGEQAAAIIAAREAETDEEAEAALLAPFLFGRPRRMEEGREQGTTLASQGRALSGWLRMLCGLDLGLGAADPAATDGRNLFLPRSLPAPAQPGEDALIYRVMGLYQLGLVAFGLLERGLLRELHEDWVLRCTWQLLAARAIRRRWSLLWPGLRADLSAVCLLERARALAVNHTPVPRRGIPEPFALLLDGVSEEGRASQDVTGGLSEVGSEVRRAVARIAGLPDAWLLDTPRLSSILIGGAHALRHRFREARLGAPPLPRIIGILRPEWILDDLARDRAAEEAWREGPAPLRLLRDLRRKKAEGQEARSRVAGALRAALGKPEAPGPTMEAPSQEDRPVTDATDGVSYEEWDRATQSYRADAVRVRELDAPLGDRAAWDRLIEAQEGTIRQVRRRFAALKVDERWLHGQEDGPELDLDRAVRAAVDLSAGWSPPKTDWHARYVRQRRDLAVLVLVDLSGSTQGGTLYREQEAVVVLAEGLRALELPHAFYGFSNDGPRDCRFCRIKGWEDAYDEPTRRRLAGLRPGGATRLGAFLRHAAATLARRPESRRLLLLISDGRPEDRDGYRGAQGLDDSAVAAAEARRQGVVLHCTSLAGRGDADQWLKPIFGPGRYLVLERAEELPARLPEVLAGMLG